MKLGLMAVLVMVSGIAAGADKVIESPRYKMMDDIVTSGIDSKVYPGAVLIIGSPDGVEWSKAYGKYSYEPDAKPMTLDTLFDMASVSKVVGTATAAMALMEDGKLKMSDRVDKYIPGFNTNGKEQDTLKDLVTHVSGLPSYVGVKVVEQNKPTTVSAGADAMINHIAGMKAIYPPRTKVNYSCLNMQMMARVNENALGGRMDDYLKKRVYGPLGMKDTGYVLTEEQKERTAPTVKKGDGSFMVADVHDPLANYHTVKEHCPGNAGLFSTGPDIVKYCKMILSNGKAGKKQVLKPATVKTMTTVHTPEDVDDKRGLGWDVYSSEPWTTPLNRSEDTYVIGHTGYTGTLVWIDKLSKIYVIFLTNRTMQNGSNAEDGRISGVRREIVKAVLHSLPEYKKHFAEKEKEKSSEVAKSQ